MCKKVMGLIPSQGLSVVNLQGLPDLMWGGGVLQVLCFLFWAKDLHPNQIGVFEELSNRLVGACARAHVCVLCTSRRLGKAPAILTTHFSVTQFIAR